ncbi:MAG: hypothetical protein J6J87_10945 [Oscillospiraceae bacterium]|nr:hypothetical protein [Oscillospiraceae bacterium]
MELPISSLTGGTAVQEVANAGGNAALFTMKAENGHLAYVSAEGWANYAKVTQTDPDLNGAITEALASQELYAVARVSCFKDDDTPYYYGRSNGLRTGNGNWRDETGSRWFSPAIPATRNYITNICLELAALGFDEIWLDYCTFPTQGRLASITRNAAYNDATLVQDLEGFYTQVHDALTETYPDVKLSFTASAGLLSGAENEPSGQTLAQLTTYADRIYLTPAPEGSDYTEALEALAFPADSLIYFGGGDLPETAGQVLPGESGS